MIILIIIVHHQLVKLVQKYFLKAYKYKVKINSYVINNEFFYASVVVDFRKYGISNKLSVNFFKNININLNSWQFFKQLFELTIFISCYWCARLQMFGLVYTWLSRVDYDQSSRKYSTPFCKCALLQLKKERRRRSRKRGPYHIHWLCQNRSGKTSMLVLGGP